MIQPNQARDVERPLHAVGVLANVVAEDLDEDGQLMRGAPLEVVLHVGHRSLAQHGSWADNTSSL
jgi:hypothetical protein